MNIGQLSARRHRDLPGQSRRRAPSRTSPSRRTRVQFGARVELYAGEDIFNVFGFIGLDVLIKFNPFHFIAELAAMLAVRTGSTALFAIKLDGDAGRPDPVARARLSVLRDRLHHHDPAQREIRRDQRRGARHAAAAYRRAAEADPEGARQPGQLARTAAARIEPARQLRELPDPATRWSLHPFGALDISQKVVPLDIAIQRFGSRRPDRRQRLPHRAMQHQRCARRHDQVARAIRAGAVLRDVRRREALAPVVRALRRRDRHWRRARAADRLHARAATSSTR